MPKRPAKSKGRRKEIDADGDEIAADDDSDYEYEHQGDEGALAQKNARLAANVNKGPRKREKRKRTTEVAVSRSALDLSHLSLKADHALRPCWVTTENQIILEASSQIYQQAYDFLVAIAEPISRPEHIHKYQLTDASLYAAVAVSIDTETILSVLGRLCKTVLPPSVVHYITECTSTFGKAKLVLRNNLFFVESPHVDVLKLLLQVPEIRDARNHALTQAGTSGAAANAGRLLRTKDGFFESEVEKDVLSSKQGTGTFGSQLRQQHQQQQQQQQRCTNGAPIVLEREVGEESDDDDDEEEEDIFGGLSATQPRRLRTLSFMIPQTSVEAVKRAAQSVKYPLTEEYDFHNDTHNPSLTIDLRPMTKVRPYQEKALSKMFGNKRARSGIIVLPCGAGKSLTGVLAAFTIKKNTMILCINNPSVQQWKEQFEIFTTIDPKKVLLFSSESADVLPESTDEACVVITSYSMICAGKHSQRSQMMMDAISKREWGLMILDEVHVAPAKIFRQKVMTLANAHCKLGLTATMVREDDKISDLKFLVGPKVRVEP